MHAVAAVAVFCPVSFEEIAAEPTMSGENLCEVKREVEFRLG